VGLTTSPTSVKGLSRENVGASTSHNPMGLHGLLQGQLYIFAFFLPIFIKQFSCLTEMFLPTYLFTSLLTP
jgi:hypothetical protein